ncbi:MAG: patatin-like phospholipase family protein [Treponema sp.]|jgi:NTE family protein|nr:patatin-like phospholipase family protein [Treponema sp.]
MHIQKNLKWALVLSGGGSKGLAHVGVLKALTDMGAPPPSLVVGTSMGAIVGGVYACGMPAPEIEKFVLEEFNINNYMDGFAFKMNGPVGKVFKAGQILGSLVTKPGIDSGQGFLGVLDRLTGGKSFDETRIPFRCNAVDLSRGTETVFNSGSVALAVRASIAYSPFLEPLVLSTHCFADGGLSNNMPVYIARDAGFKRILAVDVTYYKALTLEELKSSVEIMYRSMETALKVMQEKTVNEATLTVHAADDSNPWEFDKKKELINLGERAIIDNEKAVTAFFSGGLSAAITRRKLREV